jgi:MHS family proline/betaine transporter-like MFS transporter
MMQSFSAGGEFGSATAYLAEQSPHRKAFYSSWQFASQGLGMVLAALCGLALGSHLSSANMVEWGWRIPFLLGAAMGPIAYYLRKNVDETPEFLAESEPTASPSAEFYKRCAVGSGIVLLCTVSIYLLIYVPSFAQTILNKNSDIAYSAALISGITLFIGAPLAGCIADKFGAIRLALLAAISLAFFVIPIFSLLISANDGESILLGQFVLSFIISMYLGAMPTVLSDIFSIRVRSLGMSISYNIAVMSGGGFAQVIFSFLIKSTGNINSPSYYIVFAALVSFLSIVACRKTIAPKRFHGLPQG